MEYDFLIFLIVCPMCMLAGFVDAIAGGGGLISLPAYLIAGLPPHFAIGTYKMSSTMGTALATFKFIKSGYVKNFRLAATCAIFSLLSSSIGARLTLILDEKVFTKILLVILPLTAFYVFRCKNLSAEKPPLGKLETYITAILSSICIGIYDGFYGPGAGTFLILILTSFAHMKLTEANGLTKVINLSTNIAALTVLLFHGKVFMILGITAGIFNMIGNYLGAKFFSKGGSKIVRPIIILVLAIFMIKILIQIS